MQHTTAHASWYLKRYPLHHHNNKTIKLLSAWPPIKISQMPPQETQFATSTRSCAISTPQLIITENTPSKFKISTRHCHNGATCHIWIWPSLVIFTVMMTFCRWEEVSTTHTVRVSVVLSILERWAIARIGLISHREVCGVRGGGIIGGCIR